MHGMARISVSGACTCSGRICVALFYFFWEFEFKNHPTPIDRPFTLQRRQDTQLSFDEAEG